MLERLVNRDECIADLQSQIEGAATDVFSDPACVLVPPQSWRQAALLVSRQGFTSMDFLTAADFGTYLRVVAVISDPTGTSMMVGTDVTAEAMMLGSLAEIFPAASWHERETAEMFGLMFTGHPDPRPLLLAHCPVQTPLRRKAALTTRLGTTWPGATEPGESKVPDRPARRPQLPPGVRREWVDS